MASPPVHARNKCLGWNQIKAVHGSCSMHPSNQSWNRTTSETVELVKVSLQTAQAFRLLSKTLSIPSGQELPINKEDLIVESAIFAQ